MSGDDADLPRPSRRRLLAGLGVGMVAQPTLAAGRTQDPENDGATSLDLSEFSGANLGLRLQRAIDALPAHGGIIRADKLAAVEYLGQRVVIAKPVTICFGPTTILVSETVESPAISIVRSAELRGVPGAGFRDVDRTIRGVSGTALVAESGYHGTLIHVGNVPPYDQFNAAHTTVKNCRLEAKPGSDVVGIAIVGTYGVALEGLTVAGLATGVDIANANHAQGFSEASHLSALYFENCGTAIRARGSAATDSIGHALWSGIRINICRPEAIGISFNSASLYASNVLAVTMWIAAGAARASGLQLTNAGIDDRTVFEKMYFESESESFVGWRVSDESASLPTIIGSALTGKGRLYSLGSTVKFWTVPRQFALNGDFERNVEGWSLVNGAIASSAPDGQTGRCLKLGTRGPRAGIASVGVPVKPGHRYRVVVWAKRGSARQGLIRLGHAVGSEDYAVFRPADPLWSRYEMNVVADTPTLVLSLYASDGDGPGEYTFYDSITIEENGYSLDR